MGWAAKKRTGRPAGGAGQHPKGPERRGGKRAPRALRPGAAGLKGSVAYPTDGESYSSAIGPAQPWPDLRSLKELQSAGRIDRPARQRRPAMLIVTRQGRNPSGVRLGRSGDRAAVPQGGAKFPAAAGPEIETQFRNAMV